jgi:hypothetical protein
VVAINIEILEDGITSSKTPTLSLMAYTWVVGWSMQPWPVLTSTTIAAAEVTMKRLKDTRNVNLGTLALGLTPFRLLQGS